MLSSLSAYTLEEIIIISLHSLCSFFFFFKTTRALLHQDRHCTNNSTNVNLKSNTAGFAQKLERRICPRSMNHIRQIETKKGLFWTCPYLAIIVRQKKRPSSPVFKNMPAWQQTYFNKEQCVLEGGRREDELNITRRGVITPYPVI